MSKRGPYGDGPAEYEFGAEDRGDWGFEETVYGTSPALRYINIPTGESGVLIHQGSRYLPRWEPWTWMGVPRSGYARRVKYRSMFWRGYDRCVEYVQEYADQAREIYYETHGEDEPRKTQRSNEMNTKEVITLMQLSNGANVVGCEYVSGSAGGYHFKNALGIALREGDLLVVETKNTLTLVRVIEEQVSMTDLQCGYDELKHVVAKVDLTAYENTVKAEKEAVHKLAMHEVTDRLAKYRETLGDSFTGVASLLTVDHAEEQVIDETDV